MLEHRGIKIECDTVGQQGDAGPGSAFNTGTRKRKLKQSSGGDHLGISHQALAG